MSLNKSPETDGRRSWEGSPTPRPLPWLAGALLLLAGALLLGTVVREFDDIQAMFMEDGPIEILQAGMLVIAAAVFAFGFLRSAGSRALFCAFAAFALIFAVTRELPRCGSAFSGDGMCLQSGWKTIIVAGAALLALVAVLVRRQEWTREVLRLSNIRWVWPCFVVVLFLAGGEAAEHRIHVEIEESLELAAYLYVTAYGLWILRQTRAATNAAELGLAAGRRRTDEVPG